MATNAQVNAYIAQVLPAAQKQSQRTGIPVSVFLTQSGYETGWGTSGWWRNNLNPAGIGVTGAAGAGQSFASVDQAFAAYADKLLGQGEAGQGQFVADVNAQAGPTKLLQDLEASPWAAGHYSGHGLETTFASLNLAQYDLPGAKPPAGGNPLPGGGGAQVQTAGYLSSGVAGIPFVGPVASAAGSALSGVLGSQAKDFAGGITAPILSFVQQTAVRAALVVFGAIAVLVGLALLVHDSGASGGRSGGSGGSFGGGSSRRSGGDEDGGGGSDSGGGPGGLRVGRSEPVKGERGAGREAASDVSETAEGAAAAV